MIVLSVLTDPNSLFPAWLCFGKVYKALVVGNEGVAYINSTVQFCQSRAQQKAIILREVLSKKNLAGAKLGSALAWLPFY